MDRPYWFKIEAFRYSIGESPFSRGDCIKTTLVAQRTGAEGPFTHTLRNVAAQSRATWWPWAEKQAALLNVPHRAFSLWLYQVTIALRSQ